MYPQELLMEKMKECGFDQTSTLRSLNAILGKKTIIHDNIDKVSALISRNKATLDSHLNELKQKNNHLDGLESRVEDLSAWLKHKWEHSQKLKIYKLAS